jgi:cytochrome o ubiquinol oxidase subunit 3
MIAGYKGNKSAVLGWLAVTFACGAVFIGMEVNEFHHLIAEGHGPMSAPSCRPSSAWWACTACT